ncbi:glycosyltransferase 87 family protein [Streptomyces iconiensis]|uniref:Glycosyltransferase 87 family protein n=1 Tax=Streptomyces iconiensis TaxID=1384038 RepID=A0ABT7A237_9ACTN|nr:glycosyltransferase 87 family protein [Streptomyces iconiensis]MDJ1135382.1 glycosyltransferase 87 family protein [Streptomyces iconiensis]
MRGEATTTGGATAPVLAWAVTRAVLLLCVFKVFTLPGDLDVTADVSVIYHGWFETLRTGTFPTDDVTWQYPPAAALAILSPGLLTGLGLLDYASAFYVLACTADAAVLALLLYASRRRGCHTARGVRYGRRAGVWLWIAGVPLLGPTAYARYDLMVTAVAVAALLAAARRPRAAGALTALGAMVKVWPALLLLGARRGRAARAMWTTAAAVAALLMAGFTATMPGALDFLTAQGGRGTEVESVGALALHVARHFGWEGQVLLHYGSMEFVGPHVRLVSDAALALTVLGFGWLLLWRLRARAWTPGTHADAAFAAVLVFTTTSRVLSPQYLVWLVGLAAVCLTLRASRQVLPACLVLAATGLTLLEFPIWFAHVVASDGLGILVLATRNGLLIAATLIACTRLWRTTVTEPRLRGEGEGEGENEDGGGNEDEAGHEGDEAAGAGGSSGRKGDPPGPHSERLLTW